MVCGSLDLPLSFECFVYRQYCINSKKVLRHEPRICNEQRCLQETSSEAQIVVPENENRTGYVEATLHAQQINSGPKQAVKLE